ncbi:hypothetical protein ACIBSV_47020 [Embleya sp. NPDC050154]|uniref:hypothetical protein n=1 Tax=Embleya sp. NPDC050154 TaxID=3363988 RepID=UPI00379C5B9A
MTTAPYEVTPDPDGRTWRRTCHLCPTSAVGDDEAVIRERAQRHQDETHSGRTNSSAGEVLAVATAEIRRLQAVVAEQAADFSRLHADATRALGALALFVAEHSDPGAEALEAQYCLTQTLVNTRRSLS